LDLQPAISKTHDEKGKTWAPSNARSARIRAKALIRTGSLTYAQGNLTLCRAVVEEGLALFRELGDKEGIASSLNTLGSVASQEKDYASARLFMEESLTFRHEAGDKYGIAVCLGNLGLVAYAQGDYNAARSLTEQCMARAREIGHKHLVAAALVNLGLITLQQGDYALSRSNFEQSLELQWELGHSTGAVYALVGLGALSVRSGQSERGTKLLAAAEALAEEVGMFMENEERAVFEQAIATARQQSGEEVFRSAWDEGRKMSGQQAVDYALLYRHLEK
jgi:tetratricopeptide (TPR) repeat protein